MCKKVSDKEKAITTFFDKLRGEPYSEPRAIYEYADDGRTDLLGFSVIWEDILTFFEVMSDLSVRCCDSVPFPAMGNRGVAAYFGGDFAEAL